MLCDIPLDNSDFLIALTKSLKPIIELIPKFAAFIEDFIEVNCADSAVFASHLTLLCVAQGCEEMSSKGLANSKVQEATTRTTDK